MVAMPFAIVLALGVAYQRFGDLPAVRRALVGMSSVAAGLILATAIKMARAVRPRVVPICLAALAFVGVGVIRFSLIAVIAVLAPAAVLFSWKSDD
jgi:chromate transporter